MSSNINHPLKKGVYKLSEQNRTQRLTPKAAFITDKVLLISGKKKGRNKIIENSLAKDYPLFSEIWDNENKAAK